MLTLLSTLSIVLSCSSEQLNDKKTCCESFCNSLEFLISTRSYESLKFSQKSFQFLNFILTDDSKKFKVIITWEIVTQKSVCYHQLNESQSLPLWYFWLWVWVFSSIRLPNWPRYFITEERIMSSDLLTTWNSIRTRILAKLLQRNNFTSWLRLRSQLFKLDSHANLNPSEDDEIFHENREDKM